MNYRHIYDQIVDRAKVENRVKSSNVYYEAHHIIPRCLGGGGMASEWRTHPNIVLLTAKEHFLCHRLLCWIYPDNSKLAYAYWGLCNQRGRGQKNRYTPSSRAYEEARKLSASNRSKAQQGSSNSNYGRIGSSNPKSKRVVQMDAKTNEILAFYSNAVEAAKLTGLKQSNINNCCLQTPRYKTAGGFIWQFANS